VGDVVIANLRLVTKLAELSLGLYLPPTSCRTTANRFEVFCPQF
jgi:hypothetical protein